MGKKKKGKFGHFEPIQGRLGHPTALRKLFSYLIPLKGLLALGFLFTLLWVAINLGYGKLVKGFFDTLQNADKHGGAAAAHLSMEQINLYALLTLAAFVARGFIYFGMNYSFAYAGNRLTLRLRNEVFEHLQSMPIRFFDNRKTGQLMASLSNDVPQVTEVLDAIRDLISAPLILVGGTALLFYLNWRLALVACICVPPMAWIISQAVCRIERYTTDLQNSRARVLDVAEETIAAVRVVKSFANEDFEVLRFRRHSYEVARAVLRGVRVRNVMRPSVELLGSLAVLLVVWFGGYQAITHPGSLTFGSLVWFAMVLQQVGNAARDCGNISVNLRIAGVAADRVFTLMDMNGEEDRPDAIELKDVRGQVRFENVSFAYKAGIPVLANINFSMEPGQVVALVGPTGAGKTTIAALIPRFYDVSEGKIRVDGIDIRDCTLKSLRGHIGIVPQDTVLFAGTLRDNIAYGRLNAKEREIVAAAKAANAWEFIEKLPQGLETVIGERGVMLSGGQRQRIAIARAVLRNPQILILDEATSSLDSQSEALVQDALQKLVENRTTLVIAHRLSTVRNADKILVIKDGGIVESGCHEELMAHGGIYSELYRTQFRDKSDSLD